MLSFRKVWRVAAALGVLVCATPFSIIGLKARLLGGTPTDLILVASQGGSTQQPAIATADLISAQDLAKLLQSPGGERPLLIYVGFRPLYIQGHIPGSEFFGPGSNEAAVQRLRKRVQRLARNRFIVVYCGCCPWIHCPNVKPSYEAVRRLGFTKLKVLYIPSNLGTDWASKGYPLERGE